MKFVTLLLGCIFSLSSFNVWAHSQVVIGQKNVQLSVDLSRAVVRQVNKGFLFRDIIQISVPELAAHTLMNHQEEGDSAPNLKTYEVGRLADVVKNNPIVELHNFEIIQTQHLFPFPASQSCAVWLKEDVTTRVRGFQFITSRSIQLPDRHIDDCHQ